MWMSALAATIPAIRPHLPPVSRPIALATGHARSQPATYMYLFDWRSPMNDGQDGTLGACHALDLPFTFGALSSPAARTFACGDPPQRLEQARQLSGQMMDAWIAFAKTGDPNHPDMPTWEPYNLETRPTMVFNATGEDASSSLEGDPDGETRAFWDGVSFDGIDPAFLPQDLSFLP